MMMTYDSAVSLYMLVTVINFRAVQYMNVAMETLFTLYKSKQAITIMCSDIHRLKTLPLLYYTPLLVLSSLLGNEPALLGNSTPSQQEGGGLHHHQEAG
jgi:hypothetical protein